LLDRLPASARDDVLGEAQLVELDFAAELFAPGDAISRLYFPVSAVCSLLVGLKSGHRAETRTVGNEGMVGIPAVLGARPNEFAVIQAPGEAYAMKSGRFRELMDRHKGLEEAVREYIAYALHVAKQSAACNAYHAIDARLARWLLTMHDRARGDDFMATQEMLSHMVAASRPRVGEAAARLRERGLIDYARGRVHIRERAALEQASCECYAATRRRN
jgi:CRP-like cAMP-binding protein